MSQMIEMRASVTSILFGPADDGYTMLSLKSEGGERVVAAGRAVPVGTQMGDEVVVTGKWTPGKQGPVLRLHTARRALPRTNEGIEKWLAKAKIPMIGPTKARKLVDRFGTETIEAICEERDEAVAIVGRKAMPKAAESVRSRRQEAEIGTTLAAHGIGARTQKKIMETYGERTHKVLMSDPYRLIMDVDGIAFGTADKIAQAAGLPADAPSRIQAAIVNVLGEAGKQGHCALYHSQMIERVRQLVYVGDREVEDQIAALVPKHIVETQVREMRAWAPTRLNRKENELGRLIVRKLHDQGVPMFGEAAIAESVDQAQANLGLSLSPEQRSGAIMAMAERISVLTGGPGTGKTHTLRVICEAWRLLAQRIRVRTEEKRGFMLGAPTGKAAKRITETTGFEAQTMHRMLEYKPETHSFERNLDNPLVTGLICIDEASMPDVSIANDLARAWGDARVLFIGDIDQLPSVGPGRVLGDMLASGKVPHTRLTTIFRQAAGSGIAVGAEAIRRGSVPPMSEPGQGDLVHIEIADTERAAARIVDMYVNRMPAFAAKHGLDPASIQVLCPGHQNEVGTLALNRAIQERLRGDAPDALQVGLNDKTSAGAGDKVIQLENDYERGIYNGDTGQIVEVERAGNGDGRTTHVDFGGVIHTFEGAHLGNLGLAYALSIHKSQGSEYQIVIMPITTSHYTLLRRPLIYTGTTRAKRLCVYVGTLKAIRTAVQREDSTNRITTLMDCIMREAAEAEAR